MSDYLKLQDFLTPVNKALLSNDEGYQPGQIGNNITTYEEYFPDLTSIDIVLVGADEQRGEGIFSNGNGPDKVRAQLYQLFYWHPVISLADIGNIKTGARLTDTYAAIKTVVAELIGLGKTVLLIGGSHDLSIAQYEAYVQLQKIIDVANIDAFIDLKNDSPIPAENFLMNMLTNEPNFIRHYNHIGFQSYYVHPGIMDTMNKLGFDCFRVGKVKEDIEEMEPVIRSCSMMSIDINAMAHAYAPGVVASPNGFTGEDICTLTRHAGMSSSLSSLGIYGYKAENDVNDLTAKQIAHMIWYFIDGKNIGNHENKIENRDGFIEYHNALAEIDTLFLQSKKTGRWWMQMPDKKFIPCSKKDYILAGNNELPERWLREQERS